MEGNLDMNARIDVMVLHSCACRKRVSASSYKNMKSAASGMATVARDFKYQASHEKVESHLLHLLVDSVSVNVSWS